jgi:hypothetical protein
MPTIITGFNTFDYRSDSLVIPSLITRIDFITPNVKLNQVEILIFDEQSQLTNIDNHFFFHCLPNLKRILQYPLILSICDMSFKNLNRLTSFTPVSFEEMIGTARIPPHINYLGDFSFFNTSVEKVIFESSITYLGTSAFSECSHLTSVIGYQSNIIPPYMFSNSTKLQRFSYHDKTILFGCYLGNISIVNDHAFSGSNPFLCIYKGWSKNITIGINNERLTDTIGSENWCQNES